MSKAFRHQRIRDLVKAGVVSSQSRLCDLLARENLPVTQSTLSRDIKELQLVKTTDGYRLPDSVADRKGSDHSGLERSVAQYLSSCQTAHNLLVLKTAAGHAHPLAVAIDRAELDGVVGSIAGDDTILVVTPSEEHSQKLADRLLRMAEGRR